MAHSLSEFLKHRDPDTGAVSGEMTQTEFAEKVGLTQSYLSRFLSGRIHRVKPDIAERIVKATGGRVTLLDLTCNTPHFLSQKRAKRGGRA